MKVLILNGSARANGCTARALKELENTLHKEGIETETILIGNKDVRGCIACRTCANTGKCVFDDVANEFVEKAKEADGFIFGSPVHYAGATGAITSFMDRVFYSASSGGKAEYFLYKPAAAISSARRAGTTATYDQLNKYFGINQMPIISSRYWNMVHGNSPEEVVKDEEGMQIMRILGKNMAYYLKCIEAGKEKGIEKPQQEEIKFTNFIR